MISTDPIRFTPAELMDRYEIKKDAYYSRLKYLQLKSKKDPETKEAYLEESEVELLDRLHDWIQETGSMSGFLESDSDSESEGEGEGEAGELAVSAPQSIRQTSNQQEIEAAVSGKGTDRKILQKFDRGAQTSAAAALIEARNILAGDYIKNPEELDEDLKQQVFFMEDPQQLDREWAGKNLAEAIRTQKRRGF